MSFIPTSKHLFYSDNNIVRDGRKGGICMRVP
nr:MAG TPA: hypothetical protein [Caudoviricetes sp.]